MTTNTTTKIHLILLLIFAATFGRAESTIPFWSESFANFNNGIPANWLTGDEAGNEASWKACNDYFTCEPNSNFFQIFPAAFNGERFESNSFENGYAFLSHIDEDGLEVLSHRAYLTTPNVDCSGQLEVHLVFRTLLIAGLSNPDTGAIVQVKAGNGAWVDFSIFPNLNTELLEVQFVGVNTYNPHVIWLDISSVAAGNDAVQIRWLRKFKGDQEFFWGIDDVELLDENPVYENAVWGQPGQGDFAGSLAGWGAQGTNSCNWHWNATGLVDEPDQDLLAEFYGCSPSVTNGTAVINAGFCLPEFSNSELTSPVIDLSGAPPGKRLSLRFHQTGSLGSRELVGVPITSIKLSTNGGLTYPTVIEVNANKPYRKGFCETLTVPLPDGLAGEESIRLKFVFHGRLSFWMIDDVRIIENWDLDLAVRPVFFSVATEHSTPGLLVKPIHFAAEVENMGNLPSGSSQLFATVFDEKTKAVVFRDTLGIGVLAPGETAQGLYFQKQFQPPSPDADYMGVYLVKSDLPDSDTLNNKVRWTFEVTGSLLSKTKGPETIYAGFAPTDKIPYEIGNCFFIPPGSNVKATHLSFAMQNGNAVYGTILKTRLHKWVGDINGDTLANKGEEYEPIAFNDFNTAVELDGSENLRTVQKVPISFDYVPVPLEDSTYYIVSIIYDDIITNPNTQAPVPFFISASEEIDYSSTFVQSFQNGAPQYVSMLRLDQENDFRANSWGLRRVPFVQLHVESLTPAVSVFPVENELALSPNPANDLLTVRLRGPGSDGGFTVEIFDISGRRALSRQFESGFVSQIPIDVSELSNGAYILRVVGENFQASEPFAIIKE